MPAESDASLDLDANAQRRQDATATNLRGKDDSKFPSFPFMDLSIKDEKHIFDIFQ